MVVHKFHILVEKLSSVLALEIVSFVLGRIFVVPACLTTLRRA